MNGQLLAYGGIFASWLTASGDVSIAGNFSADITYLSELYVSPNGTHLSGLFVSDASAFAGAVTFQASATAAAGLYSQGTTQLLGGGLLMGDFTIGSDLITSTPTDTTLTFRMTSDVFFSGGALLRADNDARLRGVARAARYAVNKFRNYKQAPSGRRKACRRAREARGRQRYSKKVARGSRWRRRERGAGSGREF